MPSDQAKRLASKWAGSLPSWGERLMPFPRPSVLAIYHLIHLSAQLWAPGLLSKSEDSPLCRAALLPCCPPHPWRDESNRGICPGAEITWGLETAGPSQPHQSLVKKECPLVGTVWSCSGSMSQLSQGQNNPPVALLPWILNMPLGLVCFSPCVKKNK